ncbi:hypothetical protein [Plantibacter sp. CFBP 8804]|uniref:hypothetical protein n=1 Tax=Plantibacter sp. CFBP 8804 TaxID=2775270 RepID=UPI00177D3DCC|nr:hypothetical protein [Plantibacter sp. CFBP 8804]MBD8517071.1 hypothetical protein [Plantibacter sp. CFBP 8804]
MSALPDTFDATIAGMRSIVDELQNQGHPEGLWLVGTFAFWAVSLDDGLRCLRGNAYGAEREADPDGSVMAGIRLARNAVSHGQVVCAAPRGLSIPFAIPFMIGAWKWLQRDEIAGWAPRANAYLPRQQQVYDERLAGRFLVEPLADALRWFEHCGPSS